MSSWVIGSEETTGLGWHKWPFSYKTKVRIEFPETAIRIDARSNSAIQSDILATRLNTCSRIAVARFLPLHTILQYGTKAFQVVPFIRRE
jgi:hypothetical protein